MSFPLHLTDADPELVAIKLQKLNALRARAQLVRDMGFGAYRPHEKQDLFHRAGNYKRRAFFAGNRTGKSECGVAETTAHMVGCRAWYPQNDPARLLGIAQRPIKAMVLSTDWGVVHEVFTSQSKSETSGSEGKFWKMFPRGYIRRTKRNHDGVIVEMEGENGSSLRFDVVQAFKKDPGAQESTDYDVIHIDEPIPRKMFSAKVRGTIDRGGIVYFMLTPLREPWIYDMFYGDEADIQQMVKGGAVQVYNNNYWSVSGSIWDNPYLSREDIELVLAEFDDDERECREYGVPTQFAGLIYKEFNSGIHVPKEPPIGWDGFYPPMDWPVYWHIDPHPQTPTAVQFVAVSPLPFERKFIYDVIFERGNTHELAGKILEKLEGRHSPRAGLGDPCMWNEDNLTGTCWATDFMSYGLYLEKAVKDLQRGIPAAKAALKQRLEGAPVWNVMPQCKRWIWEAKRYMWDKDDKPVDKDDHLMECFYREVLANPKYIPRNDSNNFAVSDMALPDNPLADEVWNVNYDD